MKEQMILDLAIDNLYRNTGIKVIVNDIGSISDDGRLTLIVNDHPYDFNVEIKNEIRSHNLHSILQQKRYEMDLLLIANKIFPSVKEELRKSQISYLETSGNIFIKKDPVFIWIDGKKSLSSKEDKQNRALTKTGLKVVFLFLQNTEAINWSYREIAQSVGVGLGNINYVFNGLKELGFLVKQSKNDYRLINKKQLIEQWVTWYSERLKPSIKIGNFRFINSTNYQNWQNIDFDFEQTCWGGEPAADLLTNYLRPEIFTIFSSESRNNLMKNYGLMPDSKGNVMIMEKFWKNTLGTDNHTAHPILVYADLMNTNDKRCLETAKMIYERQIEPSL